LCIFAEPASKRQISAPFLRQVVAKAVTPDEKGNAMFFEIAEIEVKPGEEGLFEAGVAKALPLFQRAKGCRGMELQRSVEKPSKYRLVVKWETVEDHTVHFRDSDDFQEWRKLAGAHFASPPVVEHTHTVFAGF
jgi:heme-degrading monooxygenase HmoA